MQLTQEQILRLVERLEIPNCGCKWKPLPCGCRKQADKYRDVMRSLKADKAAALAMDDQELASDIEQDIKSALAAIYSYERCNCPPILPPPCEHIFDHELPDGFTEEDWVSLVSSLDPATFRRDQEWRIEHDYKDPPPPPPANIFAMQHETRVALYAKRHDQGFGLYGPMDLVDPSRLAEDAGILGELGLKGDDRLRNGQDRKGLGLGTRQP